LSAAFGIVTFSEASVRIQHYAIPYERSTFRQEYRQRKVPGHERIFSMFFRDE